MAEVSTQQFNQDLVTDPTLPEGSVVQPVNQVPNEEELVQGQSIDPNAVPTKALEAEAPPEIPVTTVDAALIGDQTPQVEAQTGTVSDDAQVTAVTQENLSAAYENFYQQSQAQLTDLAQGDPRATVQYQYNSLMDFGLGEIPGWAKGAIVAAQEQLAARGLGGSSIAAEGITAALMQAALPIAMQDSNIFANLHLAVLDKTMQAAFMKAGHIAQLDLANLNNRQQAAVINAQHFLAMDLANLDNRQQAAVVNMQALVQTLMSDQSATNAALQFNATSQNQVDMFYTELATQIDTFNIAQQNDVAMFNAEMTDMREQFNVRNAMIIEQSNALYLRDINTANTAAINEANYLNTQNLLEISNTAFANEIQLMRDHEAFAFDASQNELDRIMQRWLTELQIDANLTLADVEQDYLTASAIGELLTTLMGGVMDNWDDVFGDDDEGV